MAEPRLQEVPVEYLEDHPQNPRFLREDVVEEIAKQLVDTGEYRREHAITVRTLGGNKYQVISGHHRKTACWRAARKRLWAWVVEMDDQTAYMQLILANSQSELSPIEIGVHALQAAEPYDRSGGGVEAYAKKVGRSTAYITQVRAAADVLRATESLTRVKHFADKAKHLNEIHKLPVDLWKLFVKLLERFGWSKDKTTEAVKRVREALAHVKRAKKALPDGYLPINRVATQVAEFGISPHGIGQAIDAALELKALVARHAGDQVEEYTTKAFDWLVANAGGDSWDFRRIERYSLELENEITGKKLRKHWGMGRWQDNRLDALPDKSVRVLLCDPPYGMDYNNDYGRSGHKEKHGEIEGDETLDAAMSLIDELMAVAVAKLADESHVLVFCSCRGVMPVMALLQKFGLTVREKCLIWNKNNWGLGNTRVTFGPKHEHIVHAVKGSPTLYERHPDVLEAPRTQNGRHPTEKPVSILECLIKATTVKLDLVLDPFGGVASTAVAAAQLSRGYWSCEPDEDYWKVGQARLAEVTQNGDH